MHGYVLQYMCVSVAWKRKSVDAFTLMLLILILIGKKLKICLEVM